MLSQYKLIKTVSLVRNLLVFLILGVGENLGVKS